MKKIKQFVLEVGREFSNDDTMTLAASLSYYTIFSIAPILVIVIGITSLFTGGPGMQTQLFNELGGLFGQDTASQLQEIVANAQLSGKSAIATIISVATLLVSATVVVGQLKKSLNTAWNIKEKPKNGILNMVKNRLLSVAFIAGLGFIFLVSLGLNSLATSLGDAILYRLPEAGETFATVLSLLLSVAITYFMFWLLYNYLPDAKISKNNLYFGALVTTVLFILGKYGIGIYIGNTEVASTFGSAAALVSLLLWVYYSSVVVILGAEITQVRARWRGDLIEPSEGAVKIRVEELETA